MAKTIDEKFEQALATAQPLIDAKLTAAALLQTEMERLLKDAEKLADKHGIPFTDNIRYSGRQYIPESFKTKGFEAVDSTLLDKVEIYEVDPEYIEYGWNSSYC